MAGVTRVALIGPPGTGKTFIGREWCKLVGGQLHSFAEALRQEVATAVAAVDEGEPSVYYARMANPETKAQYRALMQVWGTDFRRAQDPDYWVRTLLEGIISEPAGVPVAVDDCRFPNEYAVLAKAGFTFVRLAPGETTQQLTATQAAHESERYSSEFQCDFVLSYFRGPRIQAERMQKLLQGR